MVQIIPAAQRRPTFSQQLSANLGNVLQQERQNQLSREASESDHARKLELLEREYGLRGQMPQRQMTPLQEAQQKLAEQRLQNLKGQQGLFQSMFGAEQPSEESSLIGSGMQQEKPSFGQSIMQEPQEMQGQFNLKKATDQQLNQLSAFANQPGETGVIGSMAKNEVEERRRQEARRTDKEKQFFKMNEPKVMQLADTSQKLSTEGLRYDRLQELFSDPSKLPSSFTAALFTKDGNINDIVYSQMSPQAQEAIKLIIDSTSGIKDTYGARITNFDLQTYLKKLPSLLNSPEGKQRVLRDLQIMNKLNKMHADGIMEVFEEAGGTDKIPYSTAEKKYKAKFAKQEQSLREMFVHPEKEKFNEMPAASKYLGKKIKNPETGEIFISDGVEWKPFKG